MVLPVTPDWVKQLYEAANVDGARMCGRRAMLYRGPESLAKALAQWA